MVTRSSLEVSVYSLLEKLLDVGTELEDKIVAFQIISGFIEDNVNAFIDILDDQYRDHLITILIDSALSDDVKLMVVAQKLLNLCLQTDILARKLTEKNSKILRAACNFVLKTDDTTAMCNSLAGIGRQNLTPKAVLEESHTILCAVEHAFSASKNGFIAVDLKVLSVITRLIKQVPDEMKLQSSRWTKILCHFLVHHSEKVRKKALAILQSTYLILPQNELVKSAVIDIKNIILKKLDNLFNSGEEMFVLQAWAVMVIILGKTLHCGSSLINIMLEIIQKAFKNSNTTIVKEAFISWQYLIRNFALNPEVLHKGKRLNLLIQPLKLTPSKSEEISLAKFETWWCLIECLGNKLSHYFEQVCVPLLITFFGLDENNFSFSIRDTSLNTSSMSKITHWEMNKVCTSTPNIIPTSSPPKTNCTPVLMCGCEALLCFLSVNKKNGLQSMSHTLELVSPVITGPTFFANFASVFFASLRSICLALPPEKDDILLYLWELITGHVITVVEAGNKDLSVEVVNLLLANLEFLLHHGNLSSILRLKLLESTTMLPSRVLNSSAYQLRKVECIRSTPVLSLMELLFHPALIGLCGTEERFMCIFNNLLSKSTVLPTDMLSFCKSLLIILDKAADCISNKDTLNKLWNSVIIMLQEHIKKSSEVNEGDALEHDFNCSYCALTFPVKHLLDQQLPPATLKKAIKTWEVLFNEFSRCADMVATTLPNVCCEELSAKLLEASTQEKLRIPAFLEYLCQIASIILNTVDFSELSHALINNNNIVSLSPSRWTKKKPKPLNNLTSFIKLLQKLLLTTVEINSSSQCDMDKFSSNSVNQSAHRLVTILSVVFTHVSQSNMVATLISELSVFVARLYEQSAKKISSKLYTPNFNQKLQKLWSDIAMTIQSRYNGQYDTAFLQEVSPLLESTFLHPKRSIRNQTSILWQTTFAHCTALQYPESLKPVLLKAKEKIINLALPSFDFHKYDIIEETPLSHLVESEPQMDSPDVFIAKSPQKVFGSFLPRVDKILSPAKSSLKGFSSTKFTMQSVSPAKLVTKRTSPAKTKTISPVSKKFRPIDEASSQDFVVIPSTSVKRRVLTEHQKDVYQKNKIEAALFNGIDDSQNMSLLSQFCTATQMDDSDSQICRTTLEPQINPMIEDDCAEKEIIFHKQSSENSNQHEAIKQKVHVADLNTSVPNYDVDVSISAIPSKEIETCKLNTFPNTSIGNADCFNISENNNSEMSSVLEISELNQSKDVSQMTKLKLSPVFSCTPKRTRLRKFRSISALNKCRHNSSLIRWLHKSPNTNLLKHRIAESIKPEEACSIAVNDSEENTNTLKKDILKTLKALNPENIDGDQLNNYLHSDDESFEIVNLYLNKPALCNLNETKEKHSTEHDSIILLSPPETGATLIQNKNSIDLQESEKSISYISEEPKQLLESQESNPFDIIENKKMESGLTVSEEKNPESAQPSKPENSRRRRKRKTDLAKESPVSLPRVTRNTSRRLRMSKKINLSDNSHSISRKPKRNSSKSSQSVNKKYIKTNKNKNISKDELSDFNNEYTKLIKKVTLGESPGKIMNNDVLLLGSISQQEQELTPETKNIPITITPKTKSNSKLKHIDVCKKRQFKKMGALFLEDCHLDYDNDSTDDEIVFSFRSPMLKMEQKVPETSDKSADSKISPSSDKTLEIIENKNELCTSNSQGFEIVETNILDEDNKQKENSSPKNMSPEVASKLRFPIIINKIVLNSKLSPVLQDLPSLQPISLFKENSESMCCNDSLQLKNENLLTEYSENNKTEELARITENIEYSEMLNEDTKELININEEIETIKKLHEETNGIEKLNEKNDAEMVDETEKVERLHNTEEKELLKSKNEIEIINEKTDKVERINESEEREGLNKETVKVEMVNEDTENIERIYEETEERDVVKEENESERINEETGDSERINEETEKLRLNEAEEVEMINEEIEQVSRRNEETEIVDIMKKDTEELERINEETNELERINVETKELERLNKETKELERISEDTKKLERINDVKELERINENSKEVQRIKDDTNEVLRIKEDTKEVQRIKEDPKEVQRIKEDTKEVQRLKEDTKEIQRIKEDTKELERINDTKQLQKINELENINEEFEIVNEIDELDRINEETEKLEERINKETEKLERIKETENLERTNKTEESKERTVEIKESVQLIEEQEQFEPLDSLVDMFQEPEINSSVGKLKPLSSSEQFTDLATKHEISNNLSITIQVDSLYCEEQVYQSPLSDFSDERSLQSQWNNTNISESPECQEVHSPELPNKSFESPNSNSGLKSKEMQSSNQTKVLNNDDNLAAISTHCEMKQQFNCAKGNNAILQPSAIRNSIAEKNETFDTITSTTVENIDINSLEEFSKPSEEKDLQIIKNKEKSLDTETDDNFDDFVSDVIEHFSPDKISPETDEMVSANQIKVIGLSLEKSSPRSMKFTFNHPYHSSPKSFGKQKRTRSGILKNTIATSNVSSSTDLETKDLGFSPITVEQVFSPSASPSAGILKKQNNVNESLNNSPSPPFKRRRVSFADPLVQGEMEIESNSKKGHLNPRPVNRCLYSFKNMSLSPLITTTSSKVTMASSKFITTPVSGSICESSPSPKYLHSQYSSLNLSYQDSPSQLNSQSPIYPELVGNTTSVDHILQQLTSSIWARGLNQLVKARNIHTIGDLSALTEYDVHHLPIRSPKIQTVRQVLHEFSSQLKEKLKKTNKTIHVLLEDISEKDIDEDFDPNSLSPDGMQPLPAVEEELEKLFPDKNDGECLDVTLEEVPEVSESEDIKNLDDTVEEVPEVSKSEDRIKNLDVTMKEVPEVSESDLIKNLDVTMKEVPEVSESEDLIKNLDVTMKEVPEVSESEDLIKNLDVTMKKVPEVSESEDLNKNLNVTLEEVPEVSESEVITKDLYVPLCSKSTVENIELLSKDSYSSNVDSCEDNVNLSENMPEDESLKPSSNENLLNISNSLSNSKHQNAILLDSFRKLSNQFSSDRLVMLQKDQIDDLFQSLSTMTATCFQAMKAKCVSPTSQESNHEATE